MPFCFHSAKTSAVEVNANLDEQKLRNNKIVRLFSPLPMVFLHICQLIRLQQQNIFLFKGDKLT
jgi:hypothetical protein